MTDPVDTEALRDMGAALTKDGHPFGSHITAAADEVDRLRRDLGTQQRVNVDLVRAWDYEYDKVNRLHAVIENAPHREQCRPYIACTCWKADAL